MACSRPARKRNYVHRLSYPDRICNRMLPRCGGEKERVRSCHVAYRMGRGARQLASPAAFRPNSRRMVVRLRKMVRCRLDLRFLFHRRDR